MEDFQSKNNLKTVWLSMLELPWKHGDRDGNRLVHWFYWILGWAWALAGLVGGALVAPNFVQAVGLWDTSYQDWLVLAIAVFGGLLIQMLGMYFFGLTLDVFDFEIQPPSSRTIGYFIFAGVFLLACLASILLPLVGIVFSVVGLVNLMGAERRSTAFAVIGGLLVKTFLIPFIKGLVTGALFKWFMTWLRGGKGKDAKSAE